MSFLRSFPLLTAALAAVANAQSTTSNTKSGGGALEGVNILLQYPWSLPKDITEDNNPSYAPARPPAVPLAVRSPYTSAWSSTAGNGTLNTNGVMFWDGSSLGWEGIVTVDGISYEWMGTGSDDLPSLPTFQKAIARTVSYDSSYSNFTFDAGPIHLTASFFSPVLPTDYCRTSIPNSYLTVYTVSTDGEAHNVSLYNDVNGGWVTQPSAPLTWDIYNAGSPINGTNFTSSASNIYTWVVQLQQQYLLGEQDGQASAFSSQGVFPQWGNYTFSSSQGGAQSIRYQSGWSINQRFRYVMGQGLQNIDDGNYRSYDTQEPVFAYQHTLGTVDASGGAPVTYTVGLAVEPAIRYLSTAGLENLAPWWSRCYGDLFSMVRFHYNDLTNARVLAEAFEQKLRQDVNSYYGVANTSVYAKPPYFNQTAYPPDPKYKNASTQVLDVVGTDQFGQQYVFDSSNAYGYLNPDHPCYSDGIAIPDVSEAETYYSITALSARQVHGGYVLTVPSVKSNDSSEPYMWLKEIASNGNINTIDVAFPAFPYLVWADPALLRFLLAPGYQFQESGLYPASYSLHDLGTHFPNATGHVDAADEYMPVEESGNSILMTYAIYRFTNDLAYLQAHYAILKQWATYLIEYSVVPAIQLSTDDFAGQLANQTNLAIKGIVGLAAMAEISAAVGDTFNAANYSRTATSFYTQWEQMGIDPSERHTMLAYQWRSSWGLLYNVYPAKLLGLSIIPQSLYNMQSDWYPKVSQLFGVPLDVRHYYTKSDWEMWTAATCAPATRRLFVDSLGYWLNQTSSSLPFSDLFDTVGTGEQVMNPDVIYFNARTVVGGHYALLALEAAGTK